MSARLKDLQIEVAAVRHRLDAWAGRLAALRASLASGDVATRDAEAAPPPEARTPPAPLFRGLGAGAGALDDVELTFEVLDTEDPGREGR